MRKLTYKEVKEYIEGSEGNGCKLISKEYINNSTKLKIQCACGDIFGVRFSDFKGTKNKIGQRQCKKCGHKITSIKMQGENNPMYGKYKEKHHLYKKPRSEETKEKLREANKGKFCGDKSPNFGKHLSEETKIKISKSHKGKKLSEETKEKLRKNAKRGKESPFYNPEISDKERKIKRKYPEYNDFKKEVFERDNYTCQCCGKRGGELNAHHIYGYKEYPKYRTDINNGITLSEEIHKKYHSKYGYKNNNWEDFRSFLYDEYKETKDKHLLDLIENIEKRIENLN